MRTRAKMVNSRARCLGRRLMGHGVVLSAMGLCVASALAEEATDGATPAGNTKSKPDGIAWHRSAETVSVEAEKSGKIIMADFYTDWCGVCKTLDKTSFQDDRVILLSDEIVAVKINADKDRELASQYKVKGYPTIVFVDDKGQELERVAGAYDPDGYTKWLGRTLFKHSGERLQKQLEERPDDVLLLTKMALIYGAVNRKTEVVSLLDKAGESALTQHTVALEKKGKVAVPDDGGQTARAYRMLSLYFSSKGEQDKLAATLFYLARTSPRPREVVQARIALAESYFQTNRTPLAVTELEEVLKSADLSAEEKQQAHDKLAEYKKAA